MSKPLFTVFPMFADASHFQTNLQQFQFSIFFEKSTFRSFRIVVYSEKKNCQFYEEYMGSLTNLPPRTFVYSNPDI